MAIAPKLVTKSVKYELMRRSQNKKISSSLVVMLTLGLIVFFAWPSHAKAPAIRGSNNPTNKPSATVKPVFDKLQYTLDSASSLWVVVNKGRQLPSNYVPTDLITPNIPLRLSAAASEMHLRSDAADALQLMFSSAANQNIQLRLESGYRSYTDQVSVYGGYVASSGVTQADTFSARPGHSEHQTGLAADIEPLSRNCEVEQCFGETPEGQWLSQNSYKFGFIIRYQKDTQALTGYEYEPWHIRFVGQTLASQIYQSNQTLEQFFGLPTYAGYPSSSFQLKNE